MRRNRRAVTTGTGTTSGDDGVYNNLQLNYINIIIINTPVPATGSNLPPPHCDVSDTCNYG